MHHIDRATPWEEIWQAMEQLVREGKVTYIGSSNFAGWQVATAQGVAASPHLLGLVSEQSRYNLAARAVESELTTALRYFGLGFLSYGPIGGGLLAGVLGHIGAGRRASDGVRQQVDQHRPAVEAYEALCAELGEQPADIALAWLLHQPVVSAAIVGARTAEQLTSSLRGAEISLEPASLQWLDDIWPGPGGEAPEVYAW
jgi:aryl-alcohol dehydrogenase-like predicted oxidoreductase